MKAVKQISNLFDNHRFIYFLLALSALFVFMARMHLLSYPLERDEGEYAYMGRLILDGHPPYTLAYNMKFPGTYYVYAVIMMIFGQSTFGIHLGLAFIIAASMLLMFFVAANFVSKSGACISAVSFGIIGTSWTLSGQAGHATHFVNFFALAGILVLLQLYKSEKNLFLKYFFSGILFSLAFICKQPGLFFLFLGITIIIVREFDRKIFLSTARHVAVFILGFLTPVVTMLFYFYFFGDFNKFWFWTVKYLWMYSSQVPLSNAWEFFRIGVASITSNYSSEGYTALWIVSLLGVPLIFIQKYSLQNKIIMGALFIISCFTILPGFYFREHYFITLLPAVSLLIAVFFDYINNLFIHVLKRPTLVWISFFVFMIVIGTGVHANLDYLFLKNPAMACKQAYLSNPFAESVEIGEFLKRNTKSDDKIAVLGSEPQICFYADRYSATGYIYTYNLVEAHSYALSMQREMAKEIEINKPKYVLCVNIQASWLTNSRSEKFIFEWTNEYLKSNYRNVAMMEVFPDRISSLRIGSQLSGYTPKSKEAIFILERMNKN
ncbi:MAG: glycosyltransferase family 39 protein [Bacteroidetes bacterium]|nr:glycosyltransferase family 39 protein [Bacteroidota bacterium]